MGIFIETNLIEIAETQPHPQISLWIIFTSYFIVGLTAFGMSILQKLKALVMDNHWLSEEEMNDGLAMVQLYPGPLMVDFTAYVGYKLRGVIGAILAIIGFILPSFILMSVFSALYFAAGNLPWVKPLFVGLEALVVGILFNVTLEMGGRNIQTRTQAVIMLLAFGALLLKLNAVLIVLVALALGACILTNVNAIGAKMRLQIDEARIEFDAVRRDEPPALTEIRYRLILKSPEPREKLEELHDLCVKWGTVTNTIINGLTPQGALVIEP